MDNSIADEARQFADQVDDLPRAEKIEAVRDLVHRLQFEERWLCLAPNQLKHMGDESLSIAERKRLEACKTHGEEDGLFTAYARARYFRRCAWSDYLNGAESKPPIEAETDAS